MALINDSDSESDINLRILDISTLVLIHLKSPVIISHQLALFSINLKLSEIGL